MEELLRFFNDNRNIYNLWWESDGMFYAYECKIATEEQNAMVMEKGGPLTKEEAATLDKYGLSILHYGVWHNFYDLVKELIEKGADVNVATADTTASTSYKSMVGATPLHIAAFLGNLKMVKLLLESGADAGIKDAKGKTPLHYLMMVKREGMIENTYAQWHVTDQKAEILPLLKCDINGEDENGETPLFTLLSNSYAPIIQALLGALIEQGADTSKTSGDGKTPLMLAAEKGSVTATLKLAENAENINQQDNDKNTALHLALKNQNNEAAYILIEMGGDVEAANGEGETPRALIENGWDENLKKRLQGKRGMKQEDIVRLVERTFFSCNSDDTDKAPFGVYLAKKLLKEIDDDDDDEVQVLFDIAETVKTECCAEDIIESIHAAGFDFNKPYVLRSSTETLRDKILEYCWNPNVIRKMSELGIDLNGSYLKGKTAAYIVASQPAADRSFTKEREAFGNVAEYFDAASAEELSADGMTAMHYAAKNNHVNMLKIMIGKGANVDVTEDAPATIGATPLHEACLLGNTDIVKLLMDSGADDTLATKDGETPAHFIVQEKQRYRPVRSENRLEIIKALKNVDVQRNDGKTPAMLAQNLSYSDAVEITMALLDMGIDVNKADNKGNTLLHLCLFDKDTVKEIIKAGADVNAKNNEGNTPLHIALDDRDDMVARLLIKKGADYKTPNGDGETGMDIAVANGMETVLELMEL